jgi:hypothetical protein
MQRYADIYSLQSHSTCFGRHWAHHQEYKKTVTPTSGIGHDIGVAAFFQRGLIRISPDQTTLEESMTYTRGSGYSF